MNREALSVMLAEWLLSSIIATLLAPQVKLEKVSKKSKMNLENKTIAYARLTGCKLSLLTR